MATIGALWSSCTINVSPLSSTNFWYAISTSFVCANTPAPVTNNTTAAKHAATQFLIATPPSKSKQRSVLRSVSSVHAVVKSSSGSVSDYPGTRVTEGGPEDSCFEAVSIPFARSRGAWVWQEQSVELPFDSNGFRHRVT